MQYEKPEVIRLASAVQAVQNPTDKQIHQVLDSSQLASATAYAADE